MQYVVAQATIKGVALPLAKLSFVSKITPKRQDIVFKADTLHDALRMDLDTARMCVQRCPFGVFVYPVQS
jgi:hypothetical protein